MSKDFSADYIALYLRSWSSSDLKVAPMGLIKEKCKM
jgi:hypothetical protein